MSTKKAGSQLWGCRSSISRSSHSKNCAYLRLAPFDSRCPPLSFTISPPPPPQTVGSPACRAKQTTNTTRLGKPSSPPLFLLCMVEEWWKESVGVTYFARLRSSSADIASRRDSRVNMISPLGIFSDFLRPPTEGSGDGVPSTAQASWRREFPFGEECRCLCDTRRKCFTAALTSPVLVL